MSSSSDPAALHDLVQTLLDFERAPGRYALALREPRPLFDAPHAVMLLAAGRPVKGLPPLIPGQHTGVVQSAARFFVRTVLLRPGADHYSLLGLQPDCGPETLRDHYRLMIRLTHPDFATAAEAWPADAASRINFAHDVLNSAVKRSAYDASLKATVPPLSSPLAKAPEVKMPMAEPRRAVAHPARAAATPASEASQRTAKRYRRIALAALGALACATLLWLMTPGSTDGSLVIHRAQTRPVAPASENRALIDPTDAAPSNAVGATLVQSWLAESAAAANPSPIAPSAATFATTAAPRTATQAPGNEHAAPPLAPHRKRAQTKGVAPVVRPAPVATPAEVALIGPTEITDTPANDNLPLPLGIDTRLSIAAAQPQPQPHPQPQPNSVQPNPASEPTATPLTLAQVQPKLAQVLSGLQSGKGENAVQWLEGPWRHHPAANTFVNNYQRLLAGQSVVQLGKVQLRSRSVAEQLIVDGVVELYLQDSNAALQIKELQMSAHFRPNDGQPMLTQLVLKHP